MKKSLWIFKYVLLSLFVFSSIIVLGGEKDEIKKILLSQVECWNNGDLECFMQSYWKSDSLTFIGSKGITKGWESTLKNYQESYSNKDKMGTLKFEIIDINLIMGIRL